MTFRNCVAYNDAGGALGMCCESGAELSNVRYEDCTVLHATHPNPSRGAIGIELEGTGAINGFRFENLVIEDVTGELHPALKVVNNWDDWHMNLPSPPGRPYEQANPPARKEPRGAIRNVLFRNITVLRCDTEDVVLMADGPQSPIENVTFDNVVIAGKRLEPKDPRLKTNAWVRNVVVR
ncbi:MAG: hypothetical protein FJX74_14310 [Armatimonadetes bacterium]|nr:hypothetical protein [Armatimonadota bacterium]